MTENRLSDRLNFNPEVNRKTINYVSKIDSLNVKWHTQAELSPQMIERLVQSVLITSSGSSTRIEGSRMDDVEVKELYKQLRIRKFKTRDEQEVAGYLEVLQLIFESSETMTFSEGLIKQIHSLLLKYSNKDSRHKGNYKFQDNQVEARDEENNLVAVVFNPSKPYLVPKKMQELVDWVKIELEKGEIHPLLVVANFIFEFLAIHPFEDGNGRTSRLLTNLLLLQCGYEFTPYISHEKIVESIKVEYYEALNKTQKSWKTNTEDMSPWVLFFFEVVLKQAENAIDLLDKDKQIELYLSDKQLAVWNILLQNDKVSRSEIQGFTGIPLPTVRQAISKLLEMNKIEAVGEGKSTKYRVK